MDSIRAEVTGRHPDGGIEPLGLSIAKVAEITGESPWQVKQKLRNGTYKNWDFSAQPANAFGRAGRPRCAFEG